jgi:hypothetical protein
MLDPLAMMAFHLKLASRRSTKNVLLSVGTDAHATISSFCQQ